MRGVSTYQSNSTLLAQTNTRAAQLHLLSSLGPVGGTLGTYAKMPLVVQPLWLSDVSLRYGAARLNIHPVTIEKGNTPTSQS